jgi:hypothetical protein
MTRLQAHSATANLGSVQGTASVGFVVLIGNAVGHTPRERRVGGGRCLE